MNDLLFDEIEDEKIRENNEKISEIERMDSKSNNKNSNSSNHMQHQQQQHRSSNLTLFEEDYDETDDLDKSDNLLEKNSNNDEKSVNVDESLTNLEQTKDQDESEKSFSLNNSTSNTREAMKKKLEEENANQKEILKKRKIEQQEEENKKMQVLMANFSDEQLNRYEMFRRSAFPKSSIKRIIQTVCGKAVSASVVIAMSGIAKVFVGEIVEQALDVKQKWRDTGPLQPKHLRESYRVFKKNNKLASPYKHKKPCLFL